MMENSKDLYDSVLYDAIINKDPAVAKEAFSKKRIKELESLRKTPGFRSLRDFLSRKEPAVKRSLSNGKPERGSDTTTNSPDDEPPAKKSPAVLKQPAANAAGSSIAEINVDMVMHETNLWCMPKLRLNAYCKTRDTETSIRVDFGGDTNTSTGQRPLIDITLTTQANGAGQLINADPGAKKLTRTITELSPHSNDSGSSKARPRIENSAPPSTPIITVNFQSNDCTLSGVHAEIDDVMHPKKPAAAVKLVPNMKKNAESSSDSDEPPPVKKPAARKPVTKVVETSDSSDEEPARATSSSAPVKISPAARKPVTRPAEVTKPAVRAIESSDDSDDDEPPKRRANSSASTAKKSVPAAAEWTSDSDDDNPAVKRPTSAAKSVAKKPDDFSDDSSDDEPPKKNGNASAAPVAKKFAAAYSTSDSDDSSSSSDEEPVPFKKPAAKKSEVSSSDSDVDLPATKPAPAKNPVAKPVVRAVESSDGSSADEPPAENPNASAPVSKKSAPAELTSDFDDDIPAVKKLAVAEKPADLSDDSSDDEDAKNPTSSAKKPVAGQKYDLLLDSEDNASAVEKPAEAPNPVVQSATPKLVDFSDSSEIDFSDSSENEPVVKIEPIEQPESEDTSSANARLEACTIAELVPSGQEPAETTPAQAAMKPEPYSGVFFDRGELFDFASGDSDVGTSNNNDAGDCLSLCQPDSFNLFDETDFDDNVDDSNKELFDFDKDIGSAHN